MPPITSIPSSLLSLLISTAATGAVEPPGGNVAAGDADPTSSPRDVVSVRFSSSMSAAERLPSEGSILVLLLPATRPEAELPAAGPWWDRPHPFGAIEVEAPVAGETHFLSVGTGIETEPRFSAPIVDPTETIASGGPEKNEERDSAPDVLPRWYPGPPESLSGSFRGQAVFRPRSDPAAGGPSEWRSGVIDLELSPDRVDRLEFVLEPPPVRSSAPDRVLGPEPPPAWIEVDLPSPMLEAAAAEPDRHRAWIVFPRGYHDLRASRRIWPTVYVLPHAGNGRAEAESIRDAIAVERTREAMPQAVWVVLDPRSPWGHHGFADSETHGPRATALLEELVPELERRHRLVPERDARLLLGHGAGGWSAIRLQLEHPDRFGATFVTSPELVDLSRLGWLDAYGYEAFADEEGRPRPAYREVVGEADAAVRTVVEQEWTMAETASPSGRSGNRWHRWAALASPPLSEGRPPALFDAEGRIDRDLAESRWLPLDLAAALVREPRRSIPLWIDRIHIWVGSLDESGHERALLSLQTLLAELSVDLGLPRPSRSVVNLVPGATFDSVVPNSRIDAYRAMIRHLEEAELSD